MMLRNLKGEKKMMTLMAYLPIISVVVIVLVVALILRRIKKK